MADVGVAASECVPEWYGVASGEWFGDERGVSDAVHVAVVGYSVGDVHDFVEC